MEKKVYCGFVERELHVSKIALAFIFIYVKDLSILDIMVMLIAIYYIYEKVVHMLNFVNHIEL